MITSADEIFDFVTVVSGCFDTNLFQYNNIIILFNPVVIVSRT